MIDKVLTFNPTPNKCFGLSLHEKGGCLTELEQVNVIYVRDGSLWEPWTKKAACEAHTEGTKVMVLPHHQAVYLFWAGEHL